MFTNFKRGFLNSDVKTNATSKEPLGESNGISNIQNAGSKKLENGTQKNEPTDQTKRVQPSDSDKLLIAQEVSSKSKAKSKNGNKTTGVSQDPQSSSTVSEEMVEEIRRGLLSCGVADSSIKDLLNKDVLKNTIDAAMKSEEFPPLTKSKASKKGSTANKSGAKKIEVAAKKSEHGVIGTFCIKLIRSIDTIIENMPDEIMNVTTFGNILSTCIELDEQDRECLKYLSSEEKKYFNSFKEILAPYFNMVIKGKKRYIQKKGKGRIIASTPVEATTPAKASSNVTEALSKPETRPNTPSSSKIKTVDDSLKKETEPNDRLNNENRHSETTNICSQGISSRVDEEHIKRQDVPSRGYVADDFDSTSSDDDAFEAYEKHISSQSFASGSRQHFVKKSALKQPTKQTDYYDTNAFSNYEDYSQNSFSMDQGAGLQPQLLKSRMSKQNTPQKENSGSNSSKSQQNKSGQKEKNDTPREIDTRSKFNDFMSSSDEETLDKGDFRSVDRGSEKTCGLCVLATTKLHEANSRIEELNSRLAIDEKKRSHLEKVKLELLEEINGLRREQSIREQELLSVIAELRKNEEVLRNDVMMKNMQMTSESQNTEMWKRDAEIIITQKDAELNRALDNIVSLKSENASKDAQLQQFRTQMANVEKIIQVLRFENETLKSTRYNENLCSPPGISLSPQNVESDVVKQASSAQVDAFPKKINNSLVSSDLCQYKEYLSFVNSYMSMNPLKDIEKYFYSDKESFDELKKFKLNLESMKQVLEHNIETLTLNPSIDTKELRSISPLSMMLSNNVIRKVEEKIKKDLFLPQTERNSPTNEKDCLICYEALLPHEELTKCDFCSNQVHESCGQSWFKHNQTCVLCRRSQPDPSQFPPLA